MNIRAFLSVVVFFTLLTHRAGAATFYVDASNSVPVAPFATWSTAATNIQDAIDASTNGDTILVTNGVYQFGGTVMAGNLTNRVALNKPVTVQSMNGPWMTVILGLGATNWNTAVRCAWLTNGAALVGFTLTQGATRNSGNQNSLESGGGVWCVSSNSLVSNCLIVSNTAYIYGGGVYQGTVNSSLISSNGCSFGSGATYQSVLNNCTIVSNAAYGVVSPVAMTNCIIYYNTPANYSVGGSAFSHCCTTPALAGTGNFTNAPQWFVGGFHLANSSPCVGAGIGAVAGTDIFGNGWSNPPSVGCAEWQPAPLVGAKPTFQVSLPASSLTLSIIVAGQPPFAFFWSKDGAPIQDDANHTNSGTANLVVENFRVTDAGQYQVVVSNTSGVATSSIVAVTLPYPATISIPPCNVAVTNGGAAAFSVAVLGTSPFAYQWYFTNTAVGGGTNASLLVPNAGPSQAGSYFCVVTNFYGSVTSRMATLTIGLPPSITIQPTNQFAVGGSNATLSVVVSGTGPFTYQWQFNGTNLPNSIITTIAGNSTNGFSGDGGPATNASLSGPWFAAVDGNANVFFSDNGNARVRKVNTIGNISTVAGDGAVAPYNGEGRPATNANIWPSGVAVDGYGNFFLGDANNNLVRRVDASGIITTMAGDLKSPGSGGYFRDGGAATNAGLAFPNGVAVDAAGNLFIADSHNNRIRKVDTSGIITTVAGNGQGGYYGDGGVATNTGLYAPNGVAVDVAGNLFIADAGNYRVRKVDTNGIISTVAGNGTTNYVGDGIAATNAGLNALRDVQLDRSGNLYIADFGHNCIRMVDTNGIITRVAGNGMAGYSGDGGTATNASLNSPTGVALDAAGNLFIVDYLNNRIREVALAGAPVLTLNNVNLTNAGNYSVFISNPYGSITSSIVLLTVVLPPQNFSAGKLGGANGNQLSLQLSGTPNYPYILQTATNLTPPVTWQPVFTNPADGNGNWQFTDTNMNGEQKFYRAIGQ